MNNQNTILVEERSNFGPSLAATPILSDRRSQQSCKWHWPKPSSHSTLSEISEHAIQAKSPAVSASPERWQGYHYTVTAVKQTQSSTIAPRRRWLCRKQGRDCTCQGVPSETRHQHCTWLSMYWVCHSSENKGHFSSSPPPPTDPWIWERQSIANEAWEALRRKKTPRCKTALHTRQWLQILFLRLNFIE